MQSASKFRKIWLLLWRKLTELQVNSHIRNDLTPSLYVGKPDSHFFQKLCDVVFESGLKAVVWQKFEPEIRKQFCNYDVKRVAKYTKKNVEKMIKNKRKIEACVHNAKVISEISMKYHGFWKWLDSEAVKDGMLVFPKPELIEKIRKSFKMLGYTNTFAFLRYVGFDLMKPDVNVKRVLYRLGFIVSTKNTQENFKQIQEIGVKWAKAVGVKVTTIDYLLYLYGSGGLYFKPICTEVKPRCDVCSIVKYCNYGAKV